MVHQQMAVIVAECYLVPVMKVSLLVAANLWARAHLRRNRSGLCSHVLIHSRLVHIRGRGYIKL